MEGQSYEERVHLVNAPTQHKASLRMHGLSLEKIERLKSVNTDIREIFTFAFPATAWSEMDIARFWLSWSATSVRRFQMRTISGSLEEVSIMAIVKVRDRNARRVQWGIIQGDIEVVSCPGMFVVVAIGLVAFKLWRFLCIGCRLSNASRLKRLNTCWCSRAHRRSKVCVHD